MSLAQLLPGQDTDPKLTADRMAGLCKGKLLLQRGLPTIGGSLPSIWVRNPNHCGLLSKQGLR
jgi:hypothetical protein